MQYVVRFQRVPTNYSAKEALIIEATDPVAAVMVLRDHLLRRGANPDGYVPDVGFHLRQLAEYRREGVNHRHMVRWAEIYKKDPQEHLAWSLNYHQRAIAEEAAKYVDEYVPAPGRVIGPA